jgi:hypothetical protein
VRAKASPRPIERQLVRVLLFEIAVFMGWEDVKTIQEFIDPAIKELMSRQETAFKSALDELIPGWTLDDVRSRCYRVSYLSDKIEYIYVDGDPVLAIHPIETSHFQQPDGNYTLRVTQNLERLYTKVP